MSVEVFVQNLQSKIKSIEQSIEQAAEQIKKWSDNHNGLTGMLHATKEALIDAQKVMIVVAPESPVTEALTVAEEVIAVIEPEATSQ